MKIFFKKLCLIILFPVLFIVFIYGLFIDEIIPFYKEAFEDFENDG